MIRTVGVVGRLRSMSINDGRLDLFVGNKSPRIDGIPSPNRLWINTGDGKFRDAPAMGLDYEEDVRHRANG